jgi:zinc protease
VDIVTTEVDGVPTLWARRAGSWTAGLVFRVGYADETLARSGLTHLVEHLAMRGAGPVVHQSDAVTAPTTTTFATRGGPEEIVAFLREVCAGLREPPVARLPAEKVVLRAEARSRPPRPNLVWRYGARTYGLGGFPELGLDDLTGDDVLAWSRRGFTRGNAVLWLAGGPPPAGLRLDLPAGARLPVPEPTSALPGTPAWFTGDGTSVSWDAQVPRSAAAMLCTGLLGRRVAGVLRRERGPVGDVAAGYERLTAGLAVVSVHADILGGRAGEAADRLVDTVRAVAGGDWPDGDLEPVRAEVLAALTAPEAAVQRLGHSATDLLLGGRVESAGRMRAQAEAVDAAAVRVVARRLLDDALVMLPPGRDLTRAGFAPAPTHSPGPVRGRTHRPAPGRWPPGTTLRLARRLAGDRLPGPDPAGRPGRPGGPQRTAPTGDGPDRLVAGPAGVSIRCAGRWSTVRYDECAAVLAHPGGRRVLVGHDAVTVDVDPDRWRGGSAVAAAVDARVPAGLVAHPRR